MDRKSESNMIPNIVLLQPISLKHQRKENSSNKLNGLSKNTSGIISPSCVDDLLNKIHKGYMEYIEGTEKSKRSIIESDKKLNPSHITLKNITKRREDVSKTLLQIKNDNKRLHTLLTTKQTQQQNNEMKCHYEPVSCDSSLEYHEEKVEDVREKKKFSKTLFYTKSWPKEHVLDVDKLQEKYDQLQYNLNSLKMAIKGKYTTNEKYEELKENLLREEKKKEDIATYHDELNVILNERKHQIQILKDEFAEQYPDEKPSAKCHQPDPLLPMLEEKKFESDEPKDCKLVSACIKYVNRFNEEFQRHNYKLAAQLAANSPDGILRNYITYLQFKNGSINCASRSSPAFLFCEALINTSYNGGTVCEDLSLEIIRCASLHNDIHILEHWLHSIIITWSKDIGDLLVSTCKCLNKCECGRTYLALQVYTKLQLYKGIILCHLKFNNFKHVMKYMKKYHFSEREFKDILSGYPHIQLSYLLSDMSIDRPYITLAGVVSTFLDEKMNDSIIELLSRVYTKGLHGESLLDCLLKETRYDEMGVEKWKVVLDICSCDYELAEELCACLCTRYCLDSATLYCLRDYIS